MVDSLTSDPVAFVLKRLSQEAEIADRSPVRRFSKERNDSRPLDRSA
jgi:hypothetical protein